MRLAEEVISPQEVVKIPEIVGDDPSFASIKKNDPSEIAADRRREEIAAAKLLIAVKCYANGSVPGAELLPGARQDAEGTADAENFAAEVHDLVNTGMPNGYGGVNRAPNQYVGRWLREGDELGGSRDVLNRIGVAIAAIGTDDARPEACQMLWDALKNRAR